MRKPVRFVALLFISALLMACNLLFPTLPPTPTLSPEPGPPDPMPTALPTKQDQSLPKLDGEWLVQLTQSGGIAGISRLIGISSSGEMTISDIRTGEKTASQLAADKLAELNKLVASSSYRPASQPSGCADCFIFTLQITSANGSFQAELDQLALPDSGLQPLVNYLAAMLNNPGG